ncbi:MAG: hypothetical protein NTX24_03380 [Candidatus Pacearchaeota archaeon]|nr:hypothetical protein [Candidatus Pacearchaeota archaeon]
MAIKKTCFLALFALILTLPIVSASLQHGILGYVQNAEDGTSVKGAIVTIMVFRGTDNYCNLTDTIGTSGNSRLPNWYAQDIGNCGTEWQVGDVAYINIVKGGHNVSASIALTSNGSDQVPSVQLSSSGINFVTIILTILIIILLIIFIICLLKRKQEFKNEKNLKEK